MSKKIFSYTYSLNDSYSSSYGNTFYTRYFYNEDSSLKEIFSDDYNYSYFYLLNNNNSLDTKGIVFPGLRYLSNSVIIFERPPRYENIFITPNLLNNINHNSEVHTYRIPIPWQIYVIEYSYSNSSIYACDVRMFFSNSSLNTLEDEVYLPPLTNFYADSSLCRPNYSSIEDVERYPNTINGVINEAYDWIWNSGTNLDLTVSPNHYLRTSIYNDNFHQNSILKHFNKSYYNCSPSSIYTSYDVISKIFNSWSKIDLSEICNMQWIYSLPSYFKDSFSSAMEQRINSVANSYYPSYVDSGDECCESCYSASYDEEEEEIVDQQCLEEGNCSCHDSENNLDYITSMRQCILDGTYNKYYDIPITLNYYYKNLINPNLRSNSLNLRTFLDSLSYSS